MGLMNEKTISLVSSALAVALGVAALLWWFRAAPVSSLTERLPTETGGNGTPQAASGLKMDLRGEFLGFSGQAAQLPGSWPRFRGTDSSNTVSGGPPLAERWEKQGPPVLWSIALGEGHAGPAIHRGRVYILDYDEEKHGDALRCFSLGDGQEIWRRWYRLDRKVFACEQHTPLLFRNHLFAVLPNDAGPLRRQFVCFDPQGKQVVWTSGKSRRFGLGPFLIADNKAFILNDDGVLTLVKIDTDRYIQLDQAKILDAPDAWAPMALANKRLLVRDSRKLICLDVGSPRQWTPATGSLCLIQRR